MRRLLILFWAAWATGCKAAPRPDAAARAIGPSQPPIAFENVRLTAYNGSTRTWTLRARHVDYDAPLAHLDGVHLDSFEGGRRFSQADAPSADLDERSGLLKMRGPVHVRSTIERADFSANSVRWNSSDGRLHASGHVVFHRGVAEVSGERLEADSHLKRVRITGPVRAQMSLPLSDLDKRLPGQGAP